MWDKLCSHPQIGLCISGTRRLKINSLRPTFPICIYPTKVLSAFCNWGCSLGMFRDGCRASITVITPMSPVFPTFTPVLDCQAGLNGCLHRVNSLRLCSFPPRVYLFESAVAFTFATPAGCLFCCQHMRRKPRSL